MPKIEVEEADLLASRQLSTLVGKMMQNPKARRKVLEARKEVEPEAVIPELDAARPVESAVAEVSAKFDKFVEAQEKRDAEREAEAKRRAFQDEWNEKREGLRASGYTDAGITAIEKLAEEKGIPDLEVAAAYFDRLNPPAMPVQSSGLGMFGIGEPQKDDSGLVKKLMDSKGEDEGALRELIGEALTEVRGPGQVRR